MWRAPMARARSNAANVFSGAYDEAPRCAIVMKLESVTVLPGSSLGIGRPPMVFDIGCALRGRTEPELDGSEPVLFVETTRGMVFLMCVQLQSVGLQSLGEQHETRPPPLAPLGRVDIHPVDVRTGHREKRDNTFVARADPDVAARPDHVAKDFCRMF